jgi:XTP/dITP diphosphohydrolase
LIRITVATGNPGKAAEFNRILETLPGELRAQLPDGGMPHVDETADTFEGNARLKAEALSSRISGWVVADDSGLQVDALNGEPGVHSARYGEPEHTGLDDAGRRHLLLDRMKDVAEADRAAHFVCVLALARDGKVEAVFRGECLGVIVAKGEERGSGGFGYDPVFLFPGAGRTFAEMEPAEKDRYSHRGKALWRLVAHLTAI